MSAIPEPFELEEYLAPREFEAKYMFCASDMESRTIREVLSLLPEEDRSQFLNLSLSYTPANGGPELRKEIASLYQNLSSDSIFSFAGAEEGIYTFARALLKPGDHAVCITPCYQSLASVAKSICPVTTVRVNFTDAGWILNPEAVISAFNPRTRALFLNFPHNPTGYIPDRQVFETILQAAKERGIIVFCDEVYRGIELNPAHRLPAACDLYENAVSLGVMSKSWGFPGLRVGWVACRNTDILEKMAAYKHYLSICNSAPSEWLATAVLKNSDRILSENHSLLLNNYRQVKEWFLSSPHFQWAEPGGGCIAYPRYLGNEPVSELAERILKERGVLILPCDVFQEKSQHFRVSFGRRNCPEALRQFQSFFNS